jgi:hypothetical protein
MEIAVIFMKAKKNRLAHLMSAKKETKRRTKHLHLVLLLMLAWVILLPLNKLLLSMRNEDESIWMHRWRILLLRLAA